MARKMGMGFAIFNPALRRRIGEAFEKERGRVLQPGPPVSEGVYPFLGMQPLMPELCSLRLAVSAAALPLKGPTITL